MSTGDLRQAAPTFAARFPLFMRAALLSTWALGLCVAFMVQQYWATSSGSPGEDARAYWLTGQRDALYGLAPGVPDAFLYSPAFAQAIAPLAVLPWSAFVVAWIAFEVAALWWLLKPLPWYWAAPIGLLCLPELFAGNVYLLLAVVAVLGLRHPALWAFAALTKIAPGVGALWFVARGEWRKVGVSVVATVAVVAASAAVDPGAWLAWADFLSTNQGAAEDGSLGLVLRILAAVALVVVGARTDRPWLIAPAMLLACPVNLNLPAAALLAALPRLLKREATSEVAVPAEAVLLRR